MNAQIPGRTSRLDLTREQAADLLARYPRVSDSEAKAIVAFLRKGRHLDVGMLTGDEALKPQLDSFMNDHGKELRLGLGEATAAIVGIGGLLFLCSLIWELVKPGAL